MRVKRNPIFYFDQGGNLNAVRYDDWKIHFTVTKGDITQAICEKPAWPVVVNLRADPYEKAPEESKMYVRWYAENTMDLRADPKPCREVFAVVQSIPPCSRIFAQC